MLELSRSKGIQRKIQFDLDKVHSRDPKHVPTLMSLTNFEILTGNMDQAEERFDKLKNQESTMKSWLNYLSA